MSDDFAEIEKLASSMLRRVANAERRKLLTSIARAVQSSQRTRIQRQEEPDGEKFAPRRERTADKPGAHPLKFLYPKGAADPRLVLVRSWVHRGAEFAGWDSTKGAVRTFRWDRIVRFLPLDAGETGVTGQMQRVGRLRQKRMFQKLSTTRFLKSGGDANEAWVGFSGAASRIASIHQDGKRDRPAPGAKEIRYARRVLLGLSSADQTMVLNMLAAHFER